MATFLEVEFTVTLMRLQPNGDYVESGDRSFLYYYAAPDAWTDLPDATLQTRAKAIADRMYADTNARLRAAEPSDPNYLAVKWVRARALTADEASSWPWVSARPPVWDPTSCVVVDADGSYRPVNPLELGNAVPVERLTVRLDGILPGLLQKQLPACAAGYVEALPRFGDPRPLDEQSRVVWGLVVLFWCVLDRFATGGDVADPFGTLERMIGWLVADGVVPGSTADGARQIFGKTQQYNVFRPNATLEEFIYERAWSVRYADLDPATPTAFQGFVRCLAACRETLAKFDYVEPARGGAAEASSPVFAKADAFTRNVVLPAFAEMRATLERHGKRVVVAEDDHFGDPFLDRFFGEVHPRRRLARELASGEPGAEEIAAGQGRFVGPSIVVADSESFESPYAGKFLETILFDVGPEGEVWVAPFVVYHMKFDDKLHAFAHRFDNARERISVEDVDKYAIQNHFLGAYDYFKIHARSDVRPW